jgi:hypothetical protein
MEPCQSQGEDPECQAEGQWDSRQVSHENCCAFTARFPDTIRRCRALSPLSQLNHSLLSSASSVEQVRAIASTLCDMQALMLMAILQLFSRVQVRCANTTDAQKVADTLLEFCPGIYGGSLKNRQTEPTQSVSKTQTGATPRSDQSTLLTESQMGGGIDWQGNDSLIGHQVSASASM